MFDKRRKAPKYNNPVKEFVSREWQRAKSNSSETFMQMSGFEKAKDKYNVRQVLVDAPFLINIKHTSYEKN